MMALGITAAYVLLLFLIAYQARHRPSASREAAKWQRQLDGARAFTALSAAGNHSLLWFLSVGRSAAQSVADGFRHLHEDLEGKTERAEARPEEEATAWVPASEVVRLIRGTRGRWVGSVSAEARETPIRR